MKKSVIAILLVIVLMGSLSACSSGHEDEISEAVSKVTEDMIDNEYGDRIKEERDERAESAYKSFAKSHPNEEIFLDENSKTKSLDDLMKEQSQEQ